MSELRLAGTVVVVALLCCWVAVAALTVLHTLSGGVP